MRAVINKLIRKGLASLNLGEIILPVLSILLGMGIARKNAELKNISQFIQFIFFILFLEVGSQLFQFYKKDFGSTAKGNKDEIEKDAVLLFVILFYALSFLPFSQLFLRQQNNFPFLITSAVTAFLFLTWRNFGKGAMPEFLSKISYIFINVFLLPLCLISLYKTEINPIFIFIFQILFFMLFAFLFMQEVYQIEIIGNESGMVKLMGTIPMWRISAITLLIASILFILFAFRQPGIGLKISSVVIAGLLIPVLGISISPLQHGKNGLIKSCRLIELMGAVIYLGLFFFLWLN